MPAVARGGQAEVYRADGDQPAAVKLFREAEAARREEEQLARVARDDPDAASWLVVPLSAGELEGRRFLVFPWSEETLADALRRPDVRVRLELLLGAAQATHRFHRSNPDGARQRVHRDIKPANFLVGVDGVVRLSDLGLARDAAWADPGTNTGSMTMRFAPPEQALPLLAGPRESWDVHALAVTVFYGLTRRMPMASLQMEEVLGPDGRSLKRLEDQRLISGLSASEERRWQELRTRPLAALLALEEARGWTEEDDAALREVILDVAPRAETLIAVERLAAELARALDPDPRRRAESVRGLVGALGALRSVITEDPAAKPPAAQAVREVLPPRAPRVGGVASPDASLPGPEAAPSPLSSPLPSPVPSPSPPEPARAVAPPRRTAASRPRRTSGLLASGLGCVGLGALSATVLTITALMVVYWPGPAGRDAEPPASPLRTEAPMTVVADTITPAGPAPVTSAAPLPATPAKPPTTTATPPPTPPTTRPPPPTEPSPRPDPLPGTSATAREVLLRVCPAGEVTLSVDGESKGRPGLLGVRLSLTDGPHTIAWQWASQSGQETVTIGSAVSSWCRDLLQDPKGGCRCAG